MVSRWHSILKRTTVHQSTLPEIASSYVYRGDGMRTSKSTTGYATVCRYDGQMEMQDVESDAYGAWQKTTAYALGARGVDAISTTTSSGTTVAYPIYDAHGNMISTLSKSGTNAYTFTAVRTFDAWGVIRRGAASGDPKGRYCANLGHKQDDESGLVYMRARYYEPGSGRFVTQDSHMYGRNWFCYCSNDPLQKIDKSGCLPEQTILLWLVDLETNCFLSPESRAILTAACVSWEAFVFETVPNPLDGFASPAEYAQQQQFVASVWEIAETPGVVGSVGDRARAESSTYSMMLLVDFWIIGEGGVLF